MSRTHRQLSETHIIGRDTHEWKVRAVECPTLALHHIVHVGVADAAPPYSMVRMDLSGTYLLSCSAGKDAFCSMGDGSFAELAGPCLAPPHALLAFDAVPGSRWEFSWIRYQQPRSKSRSSPPRRRPLPGSIRCRSAPR
jgi:hypothetical protein